MRRISSLFALGLAIAAGPCAAAADQPFRASKPVSDQNPQPTKPLCWSTATLDYQPCAPGGGVTAAAGAYAAGSIPDIGTGATPSATSLNGRLVALLQAIGAPEQAGAAKPVLPTPSAAAAQAIAPSYFAGISAQSVKAGPGNVFSWRAAQASAAGKIVLLNLAAAPQSGAAIAPVQCEDIASAGAVGSDNASFPDRLSVGISFVFSTSCTTYTPAGTVNLRVKAL